MTSSPKKLRNMFVALTFALGATPTAVMAAAESQPKIINNPDIPVMGPYSQIVEANGLLFLSGIIPVDPQSKQIVGNDVKEQTKHVLDTIRTLLEGAGSSLDKVVKVSVFLKNPADMMPMNEVYQTYFTGHKPARSTVPGVEWPIENLLVEIEVIAMAAK